MSARYCAECVQLARAIASAFNEDLRQAREREMQQSVPLATRLMRMTGEELEAMLDEKPSLPLSEARRKAAAHEAFTGHRVPMFPATLPYLAEP